MSGGWIQLASGNGYDFDTRTIFGPFSLYADVAVPLAGENRFVRHTSQDWSVGAHSIVVAEVLFEVLKLGEAALAGLMHDCHEAVIGDIPTPVARYIGYDKVKALKRDVHRAIFQRLGLDDCLLPDDRYDWYWYIEQADAAALHVERQLFMFPEPRSWNVPVPAPEWMRPTYIAVRKLAACSSAAIATRFDCMYGDYKQMAKTEAGQ